MTRTDFRIIRPTDNRRHATKPLALLPFGTEVESARSIPADARAVITGYRPRDVKQRTWEAVSSFVFEVVVAMNPQTSSTARRLMTMVSLFSAWAWEVSACPMTASDVFTDANVRRFVQVEKAERSAAYRFDLTRQLGTIGERLLGVRMHRAPAPRRTSTTPYTHSELAELESWAAAASTDLRRRNGYALLAACAGAGLTAQEFVRAAVDDVDERSGIFFITVTHPETGVTREIPVRSEWHSAMDRALAGNNKTDLFCGYRGSDTESRGLQGFISSNTAKGQLRPSANRLRTTWIVGQVNAGTPLTLLLELAGLSDPGSLTPHLVHARSASLAENLSTIVGQVTR